MFLDRLDRGVAELIVDRIDEHMRTTNAQMAVAQLRVLGGAMARIPAEATAFGHRSSRILVNLAALVGEKADLPEHEPWLERFMADLRQGDAGAYVNFVGDEGEARVRDAYPGATWDRLSEIKRRYDPTNLFRRNQNIPPATEGARA
jgi:FAD/FMN-containing dehydrogenase